MANSILDSFISKPSMEVKDELTGTIVWRRLHIKDVEVNVSSLNTDNPIYKERNSEKQTLTSLLSSDIKTLKIIQPSILRV